MTTEQTETQPTDVKTLSARLRKDLSKVTVNHDGETLPWGSLPALDALVGPGASHPTTGGTR